jgi:hypothetical protein
MSDRMPESTLGEKKINIYIDVYISDSDKMPSRMPDGISEFICQKECR